MQAVTITQITPDELKALMQDTLNEILNTKNSNENSTLGWMDLDEVVKYDPEKRSKTTFYKYTSDPDSDFPFHKRGKKIVVLKSEFDEWLKTGKKNNRVDITKKVDDLIK